MARSGISAAMLAQLNALQSRTGHLFEVYFDDETVRATDLYTTVTWGGNTYTANGHFLSFDGVSENLDMRAAQTRVVLSGVDQAWIAKVLTKSYLNRRLVIRKAMLDAAWQVIVDPVPKFDGLMKRPQIVHDPASGKSQVLITASHDASDVNNAAGRRTNHQLQQLHFSGDGIFKYAAQASRTLLWGGGVSPQVVAAQAAASVAPAAAAPEHITGFEYGDSGGSI